MKPYDAMDGKAFPTIPDSGQYLKKLIRINVFIGFVPLENISADKSNHDIFNFI